MHILESVLLRLHAGYSVRDRFFASASRIAYYKVPIGGFRQWI